MTKKIDLFSLFPADVTIKDMATRIGVSRQYLYMLRTDRTRPSDFVLHSMARVLRVPVKRLEAAFS